MSHRHRQQQSGNRVVILHLHALHKVRGSLSRLAATMFGEAALNRAEASTAARAGRPWPPLPSFNIATKTVHATTRTRNVRG